MATLIFTAINAAETFGTANALQTFVWSTLTAAVDSLVIYPALFPRDPVEGQRLNGLDFQHTEEGSPANRLFGKYDRVAGTLIWASPEREVENTESSGKGGSGGEFIRFRYFRDVAIEISRQKRGRPIKSVKKVFADGKPFYDQSGLQTVTSTQITAELVEIQLYLGQAVVLKTLKLTSNEAAGGPNLTEFQSGREVTISGFTSSGSTQGFISVETTGATTAQNGTGDVQVRIEYSSTATAPGTIAAGDQMTFVGVAAYTATVQTSVTFNPGDVQNVTISPALPTNLTDEQVANHISNALLLNNGTFRVWKVGRSSSTVSGFTVREVGIPTYAFAAKAAGDAITLTQEDSSFSKTQASDIRFYNGSRTQNQDSVIVEAEGPRFGNASVPAFRGRALMVVEDLELTDFGNRVPSFEFLVEAEEDPTLVASLGEILQDSGLSQAEFDLASIPTTTVLEGYAIRGIQPIKSALQPIMLAYHLVSQQIDGKIKLLPRTSTTLIDVTNKTVAFEATGDRKPPRPARYQEVGDTQVAQTASVKFFDPDNDLQAGKKQADGSVGVSDQFGEFNTNLTLTGDQAQKLANTLFEMGRITGRRSIQFDLPPSYIDIIKESVRVRLNKFNQDRQFIITRVEEGSNFVLRCEAVEEDLEVFTQPITAEANQAL